MKVSAVNDHQARVMRNIKGISQDKDFLSLSQNWLEAAIVHEYAQNFTWMDRPIMQIPQDTYAIQEILWRVKPDLIIETGIAHGAPYLSYTSGVPHPILFPLHTHPSYLLIQILCASL